MYLLARTYPCTHGMAQNALLKFGMHSTICKDSISLIFLAYSI